MPRRPAVGMGTWLLENADGSRLVVQETDNGLSFNIDGYVAQVRRERVKDLVRYLVTYLAVSEIQS